MFVVVYATIVMITNLISLEDQYNLLGGRLFMYASRVLTQKFKLHGISLTKEQWTVLMQLWMKDGISQQVIADATGKDKPSMTRLLDNLERDGYIERRADAKDRRLNLIFLTKKGVEVEKQVMPVAEQVLTELTQGLTSQEIETVKNVFNKIYHNISLL